MEATGLAAEGGNHHCHCFYPLMIVDEMESHHHGVLHHVQSAAAEESQIYRLGLVPFVLEVSLHPESFDDVEASHRSHSLSIAAVEESQIYRLGLVTFGVEVSRHLGSCACVVESHQSHTQSFGASVGSHLSVDHTRSVGGTESFYAGEVYHHGFGDAEASHHCHSHLHGALVGSHQSDH